MNDKIFMDTNLLVYLYSGEQKGGCIKGVVDEYFGEINISTQVLGEFFHILVKKGLKGKEEAKQIIGDIIESFPVFEVLTPSVTRAIDLCIRYGYSYWDSLILAVALENDCSILYTEDLQDGQIIENKLKIINPFKIEI